MVCAFGGLWVFSRETQGRGSPAKRLTHHLRWAPDLLLLALCSKNHVCSFYPRSSPFAVRPHLATRCLGTFSVPVGSTLILLYPSLEGRYEPPSLLAPGFTTHW